MYVEEVYERFLALLDDYDLSTKSLGDVLDEWVGIHNAIDETGGDFTLYLLVVTRILSEFVANKEFAAEFRSGIDFSKGVPACLDAGYWKSELYRRQRCGHNYA